MDIFKRKYGVATTIDGVTLITRGALDFKSNPTLAAGDVKISKDGGAFANLATLPTITPAADTSVQIALSNTETQAARITIRFVDQTAPKEWEDKLVIIETFGHASAQHAFDLGTASTPQTGDSFARLGAPAGASVSADVAAIKTDTGNILTETQSHPTLAEIEASAVLAKETTVSGRPTLAQIEASAVLAKEATAGAIKTQTDKLQFSATNQVKSTHAAITGAVVNDAGNGGATFKTNLPSLSNDTYKDMWLKFTSGTLVEQVKRVITFRASDKFITLSAACTGNPAPGDTFELINS